MNLNCSFCGKGPKDVEHIISGPCVYICNECVDLCVDIISRDKAVFKKVQEEAECSTPP